jgi:archaellum component FlaC
VKKGLNENMNGEEKILSAIEALNGRFGNVENQLERIETDISGLKTDVSDLKTDVSGLKTDVSGLKTDVSELKGKVNILEGKVDTLDKKADDTHNNLICFENEMAPMIRAIKEQHTVANKELLPKVEKLQETVEKLKFGESVIRLVALMEEKSRI